MSAVCQTSSDLKYELHTSEELHGGPTKNPAQAKVSSLERQMPGCPLEKHCSPWPKLSKAMVNRKPKCTRKNILDMQWSTREKQQMMRMCIRYTVSYKIRKIVERELKYRCTPLTRSSSLSDSSSLPYSRVFEDDGKLCWFVEGSWNRYKESFNHKRCSETLI